MLMLMMFYGVLQDLCCHLCCRQSVRCTWVTTSATVLRKSLTCNVRANMFLYLPVKLNSIFKNERFLGIQSDLPERIILRS